jgi:hypothetical protein
VGIDYLEVGPIAAHGSSSAVDAGELSFARAEAIGGETARGRGGKAGSQQASRENEACENCEVQEVNAANIIWQST